MSDPNPTGFERRVLPADFFGLRDEWEEIESIVRQGGRAIPKRYLYPVLAVVIANAKSKIDVFSASACFGYFSFGMKSFEAFLQAIEYAFYQSLTEGVLQRSPPTVRIILRVQDELDYYAMRQLTKLARELNSEFVRAAKRQKQEIPPGGFVDVKYEWAHPSKKANPALKLEFNDQRKPESDQSSSAITKDEATEDQYFRVDGTTILCGRSPELLIPRLSRVINPAPKPDVFVSIVGQISDVKDRIGSAEDKFDAMWNNDKRFKRASWFLQFWERANRRQKVVFVGAAVALFLVVVSVVCSIFVDISSKWLATFSDFVSIATFLGWIIIAVHAYVVHLGEED